MDLQKQLNWFYSNLDLKPVSANSIAIYLVILKFASETRLNNLKIANQIFLSKCKNLSISSFQRARNELITNGYITYKKRKKSK